MKKLRPTRLTPEQLLSMIIHSENRVARLYMVRSAGDYRPKLIHVIGRACSLVSMWHALYERETQKTV